MTAELNSWLDSIVAEPEDRHRRLVFADWLQDQDDNRAEDVRRSVDAEECLLSFPMDIQNASDRYQSWIWNLQGTVGPLCRPLLKVTNLPTYVISHFRMIPNTKAMMTVLMLHLMDGYYVKSHHLEYNMTTYGIVDLQDYFYVRETHDHLILLVKADRPTEVKVRLALQKVEDQIR